MSDMILAASGMHFAAYFVWLTVRIVNRDRDAKRVAWILAALLVAYPLSCGPMAFTWAAMGEPDWIHQLSFVYTPITHAMGTFPAWVAYVRWWEIRGRRMR